MGFLARNRFSTGGLTVVPLLLEVVKLTVSFEVLNHIYFITIHKTRSWHLVYVLLLVAAFGHERVNLPCVFYFLKRVPDAYTLTWDGASNAI